MILPSRRKIFLLFALPILASGALLFYLHYFRFNTGGTPQAPANTTATEQTREIGHDPCLTDDEYIDYPLDPKADPIIKMPKVPLEIIVKNRNSGKTNFSFQIENFLAHPLEPRRCSIYVIRQFNFDYKSFTVLPGFSTELWKYDYAGRGEKILVFSKENPNIKGGADVYFSYYFRLDPSETYLNLVRGYLGSPDYAIVVKNLGKLNDVFVLTLDDLVNKYGAHRGEIGTRTWINENRFVGFITEGPTVYDAIFVDKSGWKVSVFPTPEDAIAVNAWSPDYSWAVYNNGPGWIGVEEVAQQIYAEWRKEGRKKSLFAYNFFMKQKITLATVDNPGWDFKPKWTSGTILQYTLPSGATTTYTIPQ
jgi:hypothetical protein